MRAITHRRYGSPVDVLQLEETGKPAVEDDEVLVRVLATSVNPADWHYTTGTPYLVRPVAGFFRPKRRIPGSDMAGRVEAVGANVTQFQPGDEVFGEISGGAFAEYVAVSEGKIAPKPANLTFEQAATVPLAGFTALQALRDRGQVKPGQKVLINGASGGVGTFAVQIAKSFGAEVTAVCSTRNVEMVRSIGADRVIDYTVEDFVGGDERYDLVLDNVGNRSLRDCRRVLKPRGIYVMVGGPKGRVLGPLPRLLRVMVLSMFSSQKMATMLAKSNRGDLDALRELVESGELKPVISGQIVLSDVPEALGQLGEGHTRGKMAVTV